MSNVQGVQQVLLGQRLRVIANSLRGWLATSLMLAGGGLVLFAGLWEFGLVAGPVVTLPAPVATRELRSSVLTPRDSGGEAVRTNAMDLAWSSADIEKAPDARMGKADEWGQTGGNLATMPAPADGEDRLLATAPSAPEPSRATRLRIESIDLDTEVVQGGIRESRTGELEWETVPFVAVHYAENTALIGSLGNAVIAGHVVTLNEGNVFRNLYLVQPGDVIDVDTESGATQQFAVEEARLVVPTEVSVMAPTASPTLTLITCGGTFDPRTREFSHRLAVVAHPLR